jgi:hypothetical protein
MFERGILQRKKMTLLRDIGNLQNILRIGSRHQEILAAFSDEWLSRTRHSVVTQQQFANGVFGKVWFGVIEDGNVVHVFAVDEQRSEVFCLR